MVSLWGFHDFRSWVLPVVTTNVAPLSCDRICFQPSLYEAVAPLPTNEFNYCKAYENYLIWGITSQAKFLQVLEDRRSLVLETVLWWNFIFTYRDY
ncbi:hypothetical protein V6N11_000490 [Hibiscus sabdariffa]|uniref:Uncharacterized protein n=2 Tax=Hibiscus sabdariffa TaxID=183260 RepID=A0ABR2BSV6_9ROSI